MVKISKEADDFCTKNGIENKENTGSMFQSENN